MLMVLVGKTSSTLVLSENGRKAIESQVDFSFAMNNASRLYSVYMHVNTFGSGL